MTNLCPNCEGNPSKEQRIREELADIYKAFSSKTFPQAAAKVLIQSPEIPSSKWSFYNQFAMLMEHTADARGFRQWEEMGRHVKKDHTRFTFWPQPSRTSPITTARPARSPYRKATTWNMRRNTSFGSIR